jgi:putative ABC transport system permease protein
MGTETVAFEERQRQVAVLGTSRDYRAMLGLELARGGFLLAEELGRGAPLAVLGSTVARELFGNRDPVGAAVRIGDWRLRVIGVMAPMGTRIGVDFDQVVFVPVATGLRIFNKSSLFRILVEAHAFSDLESAQARVRALLVERHGEEDFTVFTEEALVSTFTTIFQAMTLALAAIAAISLTVAGIGIMNVMLVSVSERTREIGLLRAVGVGRGQIVAVFLTEAVLLAGAGGLAGLACGWALVRLLVGLYPALPASPPVWAVVSAVAVSLLVGAVFGLLPARRAARLDPVLALGRK